MSELRVLLRDTQTGTEAWHAESVTIDPSTTEGPDSLESLKFQWFEHDEACDCSRLEMLHRALGREKDPDIPCGSSRVVIVRAELDGKPLCGWSELTYS